MAFDIKGFFAKCKRVWNVLRKPTREEFFTVAKVASVSTLAIGAIGFAISLVVHLISLR